MSDKTEIQNEESNEAIIERVKTTLKENPNSLYLMKKGDYSVHVLIEEVKNLYSIEKDRLPRPMVKVTCFNKTKRTSKPEQDCDAFVFNEHIYFDATDLSADTLDSSKILIEVYDYHHFSRKYYFGIQEFDFEYIYSKENHCIRNLWIALANPEAKDITKINGFLKLSISIASSEDDKVELNPDPSFDSNCMMPPQIKLSYKQLEIFIFKGEDFPNIEKFFSTKKTYETYLEVKYLGVTKATQIVPMTDRKIAKWYEIIELAVPQPILSQKVTFTVKDKNKNIIGSFILSINDISEKKYEKITCKDIYGTIKVADTTKAGKIMNQNPEVCSSWNGRVYLKINYKDCEYPVAGVHKITDNDLINEVEKINRSNSWRILVKLYSASFLPSERGNYGIKISIQDKDGSFREQQAEYRNINWYEVKPYSINTCTNNLEELPDLIIYLTQKNKEICYQRIKLKEFHLNEEIFVIKLFPEPCAGVVKEIYHSGIVKVKIKLYNRALGDNCDENGFKEGDEFQTNKAIKGINDILGGSQANDFDEDEDLEAGLHKNINQNQNQEIDQEAIKEELGEVKFYTIVACVYMTRYLIAGDSNGLSDPYCEITINGTKKSTSIRNKCVNGIWNEKLIFENISFNYKELATWPVMLVSVLDKDLTSSDMLGYSYLWLQDTSYKYNSPANKKPQWQQLYLKKSNKAQGQVLLSFYIFDDEHREQKDKIKIEPETLPFNFEITALGLRDLKPLSFIKIKKPYISFDLNSINVSSINGENLQPVTTLPNEMGANPNINSVIKFVAKLPKDEIYMPEFQCDVYDHVLGGLSKRVLGVFSIDIKQIIRETERIYKEEYEEAEKVLKELENKDQKLIGTNKIDNGMSEKEPLSNNNDNIISTDERIDTNDLNKPLIIDDDQINNNISNKSISKFDKSFLCHTPSDLNVLYRGKIDNTILEKEKNNSEYFIIKPSFTVYKLPKRIKKDTLSNDKNEANGQANMQELDTKKVHEKEKTEDDDNLVENDSSIPNPDLYFPIGFNKNDNPLKLQGPKKLKNLLGEITFNEDDEKEGLIKKTETKIANNKKHYRRIFRKELEIVLKLDAPFIKSHLKRNKFEDSFSTVNDLLEGIKDDNNKIIKRFQPKKVVKTGKLRGRIDNLRMNYVDTFDEKKIYGYFKGLIRISEKKKYDEHKNYINNLQKKFNGVLPPDLTFLTAFDDVGKNILVKRSVIVRVYILELNNLAKRDTFSESDPYIKILLGDKELVNERKKAFKDCKNCKWYQYYDLLIELPGSSKLRIQVIDYDNLFSDDLIGETSIDIEDRYFDNRWQDLKNKPIEVRQLYHPDYEVSQGEVSLWIEMFEQNEENKLEPWNIEPEPKSTLEMRLIVYETEEMENLDIEDTSDIYVMAFIDADKKYQTDVHYRCSTGQGSFNWRMVMPIEFPRKKFDLTLQVYDRDILSRDDFICGGRLNLSQILNDVNVLDLPIKLTSEYIQNLPEGKNVFSNIEFEVKDEDPDGVKFWVQLEKNGKKGGRVLCSIEVVPQWYADLHPVGKGRDEPNMNPYLPPPVGRIKFSLNPFTMLNQLTGPKFRKKCYMICCSAICFIYLIFMIPYIVYFISGEVFNPFRK